MRISAYTVRLDATRIDDDAMALLGPAERSRAAAMRSPLDRQRFVARRCWLRLMLAERLGRPAASIALIERARTAPRLADNALGFSLAHCRGVALLAVAARGPVGCDIEWQASPARPPPAASICSAEEQRTLDALPPERRGPYVYWLWTRKEALLKALGVGLGAGWERQDVAAGVAPWPIVSFEMAGGFLAAVAAPGNWELDYSDVTDVYDGAVRNQT